MQSIQTTDTVIDEIRELRHRISERCGHDPQRLVAYYLKLQEKLSGCLIAAPKPSNPDQTAA